MLLLAQSRGHLVGESSGNNHAIGLAGAGSEDDTEAVEVITGGARVHHLHSAAGKAKGHGPDGTFPRPIHECIDFGDHEICRLGDVGRNRASVGSGGGNIY